MENKPRHDPNPDSNRPEEPELDLYTIPSYSSWFAWNDIHETERQALKEFFEGSSISRTPKIYKEYRDFIINKYREDPSRRLTFTEIRKSLIGDVTLLHKVFRFLETWGLINFLAPPPPHEGSENDDRVRVENGAPNGVRVVATPNSLRPLSAPVVKGKNSGDGVEESGVKLPPLASYSDVFGDLKRLHCGSCGDNCHSGYYEYKKDTFIVCDKCFKNGNYGEDKSMDDFELKDCREKSAANGTVWTEAETLLLLDSVLKHGDDWDLVAQNVQTKSKLDCITKLIELPFGESLIDSAKRRGNSSGTSMSMNGIKPVVVPSSEDQENIINEDQGYDGANENEKNGDSENQEPPLKKKRTASTSDADSSLMKQVARISTMVGPQITAAAAEAAVAMLSDEMSCPREIFYGDHIDLTNGSLSPSIYQQERAHNTEESEIKERSNPSGSQETHPKKSDIPLPLRIRAAVATGLGAAAAHAKLLAVQEEKEIEHLVATIIEAQLKKLNSKIKHCEDAELLMEKEYAAIEGLKEYILGERINILQTTYNTGTSKLLEHSSVQSQTSNLS